MGYTFVWNKVTESVAETSLSYKASQMATKIKYIMVAKMNIVKKKYTNAKLCYTNVYAI